MEEVFSKRFSGAIFRGTPETYLLDAPIFRGRMQYPLFEWLFGGVGEDREKGAFLVVGRWFLKLFLTGLKKVVMRV